MVSSRVSLLVGSRPVVWFGIGDSPILPARSKTASDGNRTAMPAMVEASFNLVVDLDSSWLHLLEATNPQHYEEVRVPAGG